MAATVIQGVEIRLARWRGYARLLLRVLRRAAFAVIDEQVAMVAAGCAYFATLALFPAISMLVAVYGLMFDPKTVQPQLAMLKNLVAPGTYALISASLHELVSKPHATLTFSLVVTAGVTVWSVSAATVSMLHALNVAYHVREKRGLIRFHLTALAITCGVILAASLVLGALVLLPAGMAFMGASRHVRAYVAVISQISLFLFVLAGFMVLYRRGPSRPLMRRFYVLPGAFLATVSWLGASSLFTYYVVHLHRLDVIYGPLGALVGILLDFYVSAFVLLAGAAFNAALEDELGLRPPLVV